MSLPRLKTKLSPGAEKAVRGGHPWVFAERLRDLNREGEIGEMAVVYDRRDRFLGVGLFDPHSPIRLRMLHVGDPTNIDEAWWRNRFRQVVGRRDGMFDDQTDGYRWINGESDGLPGLVLDRYAEVAVLKIYSAIWLPRLAEIVDHLTAVCSPAPRCVVLRLSRNLQGLAKDEFGVAEGDLLIGELEDGVVTFLENGKRFEADVLRGQKTGFFLDQRENRKRVGELSAGLDVLNLFSHSGGFSVYAAVGGARSTTDVDISAHALEEAKRNMAINDTPEEHHHQTVKADVFEWLEECRDQYDLIVVDPPSLARQQNEKAGAIRAYGNLAIAAISRLRPGGILVAASCSAHVPAAEFFKTIRTAAAQSGRSIEEMETRLHAPDHEARIPEAHYLKAIYLSFA